MSDDLHPLVRLLIMLGLVFLGLIALMGAIALLIGRAAT